MTPRHKAARAVVISAIVISTMAVGSVRASEYEYVDPVNDPTVAKECSACHFLYPPGLLPASSWQRLMSGLADHFGENAELEPELASRISLYLTKNAARGGSRSGAEPSIRISEQPWFLRKHGKRGRISPEALKRHGAKSPADCKACHRGAEKGYFEDD
ncbi:MAG: diheme cytochrome c [Hyphomicrobiaceae bacterium]|nr:diheme cytochrome c [Hyphomicrobiaceae bacterium]